MNQPAKTPAKDAPKTEAPAASAQVFPFPAFDFSKFEMPKFDASAFDLSKLEVPASLRQAADQAVSQFKDGYAKLRAAAEEASDLFEDTYATASAGAKEFNLKALESARVNANAGFDHVRDLLGAKTLSEVIELQSAYLRKQFDTLQAQAKELTAIAQKTATDTAEPVKGKVEQAFKSVSK